MIKEKWNTITGEMWGWSGNRLNPMRFPPSHYVICSSRLLCKRKHSFCFMLGSALDYAMHMQFRSNILRGKNAWNHHPDYTFGEYRISRVDKEKLQLKMRESKMTPDYKPASKLVYHESCCRLQNSMQHSQWTPSSIVKRIKFSWTYCNISHGSQFLRMCSLFYT